MLHVDVSRRHVDGHTVDSRDRLHDSFHVGHFGRTADTFHVKLGSTGTRRRHGIHVPMATGSRMFVRMPVRVPVRVSVRMLMRMPARRPSTLFYGVATGGGTDHVDSARIGFEEFCKCFHEGERGGRHLEEMEPHFLAFGAGFPFALADEVEFAVNVRFAAGTTGMFEVDGFRLFVVHEIIDMVVMPYRMHFASPFSFSHSKIRIRAGGYLALFVHQKIPVLLRVTRLVLGQRIQPR
mmetsp:Transcript_8424/g.17345  ORF Transcript_8424/g.17345 Transcript_8424/m.17345 type:complete len:237 (+) Transcript_8424:2439-3149(+)